MSSCNLLSARERGFRASAEYFPCFLFVFLVHRPSEQSLLVAPILLPRLQYLMYCHFFVNFLHLRPPASSVLVGNRRVVENAGVVGDALHCFPVINPRIVAVDREIHMQTVGLDGFKPHCHGSSPSVSAMNIGFCSNLRVPHSLRPLSSAPGTNRVAIVLPVPHWRRGHTHRR